MVVNEFVFAHSTWMTNTIDEMINEEQKKEVQQKEKIVPGREIVSKGRPMKMR